MSKRYYSQQILFLTTMRLDIDCGKDQAALARM